MMNAEQTIGLRCLHGITASKHLLQRDALAFCYCIRELCVGDDLPTKLLLALAALVNIRPPAPMPGAALIGPSAALPYVLMHAGKLAQEPVLGGEGDVR